MEVKGLRLSPPSPLSSLGGQAHGVHGVPLVDKFFFDTLLVLYFCVCICLCLVCLFVFFFSVKGELIHKMYYFETTGKVFR